MEGKCHEVFAQVAYIYQNAHVLGKVWQGVPPERRQQSIDNLRAKLVVLREKMAVRARDANDVFNFLDTLEHYNKGEGTIKDEYGTIGTTQALAGKLDNLTEELAIHAIGDCECTKPIK